MRNRGYFLRRRPSSTQARAQKVYIGWLSFRSNFSAMMGLCIILLLVAAAILAPVITSGNGLEQKPGGSPASPFVELRSRDR